MKLLRASLLVLAIACTTQAGEIQYDFASHGTGTDLLLLIESVLFLF